MTAHAAVPAGGRKVTFDGAEGRRRALRRVRLDPGQAPSPSRARPSIPVGFDAGASWHEWLVVDQREASGRTDVAVFVSDVLKEPVKISGQPIVNLVASTSGTDSDWVVKVIDVSPDQVADQPPMGGYQLMLFGGHPPRPLPRELRDAEALTAGEPLAYRFALPNANHVFLPGTGSLVQVQFEPGSRSTTETRNFCAEHLLGEARGLQEGDTAGTLSRRGAGPGELRGAAGGDGGGEVGGGPRDAPAREASGRQGRATFLAGNEPPNRSVDREGSTRRQLCRFPFVVLLIAKEDTMRRNRSLDLALILGVAAALTSPGCAKKETPAPQAAAAEPTPADGGKIPITTSSAEAKAEFLQGRDMVEELGHHDAVAHFQKAVALDANFAWAELNLAASAPTGTAFFEHLRRR